MRNSPEVNKKKMTEGKKKKTGVLEALAVGQLNS